MTHTVHNTLYDIDRTLHSTSHCKLCALSSINTYGRASLWTYILLYNYDEFEHKEINCYLDYISLNIVYQQQSKKYT